jgi:O-antigen/teichoic acid export membrane protein
MTGQRSLVRGAGIIGISLVVIQAFGYLLNVVGARVLEPDRFGAFGALQNVIVIGNVVALGIQAVVARVVVRTGDEERSSVGWHMFRFTLVAAAGLTVLVLAVAPLLTHGLRQEGYAPALLTGVLMFPLTIAGWQYGMAQGLERHTRLGIVIVANGLGRFLGGTLGLVVTGTVTGAMVWMCAGTFVGAIIGQMATHAMAAPPAQPVPALARQVVQATHAMLALYVATSIDLITARTLLSGVESGQYALGAVISKIAYWLPSFVVLAVFPRMAATGKARTTLLAAAAMGGIGASLVAAVAIFAEPLTVLIGGAAYLPVADELWRFALIGALFSLAQLLVYSRVAADDPKAALGMWATVIGIVTGVWFWHGSVAQVATVVICVVATLVTLALGSVARTARQQAQ